MAGKWLTPSETPSGGRCVQLTIPDGDEWEAIVKGALVPLFAPWNFEQYGTLTPDETAAIFLLYLDLLSFGTCSSGEGSLRVGDIGWTARDDKPADSLWCDGSQVLQSVYPLLYAAIGDTWGSADSGYFKLPDLRDRFPACADPNGTGEIALGDYGGESEHTLTESEAPSHYHTTPTHDHGIPFGKWWNSNASAGSSNYVLHYQATADPERTDATPLTTDSKGGGNAHNNMPPYAGLNVYIMADPS
jgi:microcystin-dependent protein